MGQQSQQLSISALGRHISSLWCLPVLVTVWLAIVCQYGSGSGSGSDSRCPRPCQCHHVSATSSVVDCQNRNVSTWSFLSSLEVEPSVSDVQLFLNHNKLTYILKHSLLPVHGKLRLLDISDNEHRMDIASSTFHPFKDTLEVLRIGPLTEGLDEKLQLFSPLKSLRELRVSTRAQRSVGEDLRTPLSLSYSQPPLQTLDLQHCGIASIGQAVLKPFSLETLVLSYNKLEQFPGHLASSMATTLTKLYLDHNSIRQLKYTDIPSGCQLVVLELSYNQLEVLEAGMLEKCPDLKVINLAHNPQLLQLDAGVFGHLSDLQLDLSATNIRELEFVQPEQSAEVRVEHANLPCTCHLQSLYREDFGDRLKGTCTLPGPPQSASESLTYNIASLDMDCTADRSVRRRRREEQGQVRSLPVVRAGPEVVEGEVKATSAPPVVKTRTRMTEKELEQMTASLVRERSTLDADSRAEDEETEAFQSAATTISWQSPALASRSHPASGSLSEGQAGQQGAEHPSTPPPTATPARPATATPAQTEESHIEHPVLTSDRSTLSPSTVLSKLPPALHTQSTSISSQGPAQRVDTASDMDKLTARVSKSPIVDKLTHEDQLSQPPGPTRQSTASPVRSQIPTPSPQGHSPSPQGHSPSPHQGFESDLQPQTVAPVHPPAPSAHTQQSGTLVSLISSALRSSPPTLIAVLSRELQTAVMDGHSNTETLSAVHSSIQDGEKEGDEAEVEERESSEPVTTAMSQQAVTTTGEAGEEVNVGKQRNDDTGRGKGGKGEITHKVKLVRETLSDCLPCVLACFLHGLLTLGAFFTLYSGMSKKG